MAARTMTATAWSQRQARSITDSPDLISLLSHRIEASLKRHHELMDVVRKKRTVEDLLAQANTAPRRNKARMIQACAAGVSYQRLKRKTEMVLTIDDAYTDKLWNFLCNYNHDLKQMITIIRSVQQARSSDTRPEYVHVIGTDGSVTSYEHMKIPLGIQKVMHENPEMLRDVPACETPPDVFLTLSDT